MKNFTVTILDTTGIQPYIFGSNRLRENIGASYLVSQATDTWARDALNTLKEDINQEVYPFNPDHHQPDANPHIEDNGLAAELVYAGGGNTVLLFSEKQYAVQFTQILSKRILEEAPGINLVAVHKEFDWDNKNESLHKVIQDMMKNDLDAKKRSRVPSAPLLGLGVTATCRSTQLVAVGMSEKFENEDPYLISREIKAKHNVIPQANKNLQEIFAASLGSYEFPMRTDKMGRSEGDSSYAAVVHADGNSMGKRFQNFGKDLPNRDYIIAMRKLSHSVNQAGMNALKKLVEILVKSIVEIDEDGKKVKTVKGLFPINDNKLPFRPLVYGGDDVTFVCDGRLGLELAAIYLKELEKQTIEDGEKITACAGICIVKTHYPFARAYEMSEDLCRKAKKFVKDEQGNFSALDWHLASSGLSGSITDIREREYRVKIPEFEKTASLEMRPVSLRQQQNSNWHTWEGFTKVVKHFNKDEDWKERKNKIIALREVLRQGIEATEQFLKNYRIKDEQLPLFPEFGQSEKLANEGWISGVCGYFDAIEALEFYISLED